VGLLLDDRTDNPHQPLQMGWGPVLTHVKDFSKAACHGCANNEERLAMANLLRKYNDVFRGENHDVGLTQAVGHKISLTVRTVPIRQPTCSLELEKENEASLQVRDLLDRSLIEPDYSCYMPRDNLVHS